MDEKEAETNVVAFDAAKAQPVDAAEISAHLMDMPDVTQSEGIDSPATETVIRDKSGKVWNPDFYRCGKDGGPRTDKRGFFISKRKGRPSKYSKNGYKPRVRVERIDPVFADAGMEGHPGSDGGTEAVSEIEDPYESVARGYIEAGNSIVVMVLGVDATFTEEEKEILVPSAASTAALYRVDELDPRLVLASLTMGIVVSKFQKPTVRERWTAIIEKFKGKKA